MFLSPPRTLGGVCRSEPAGRQAVTHLAASGVPQEVPGLYPEYHPQAHPWLGHPET